MNPSEQDEITAAYRWAAVWINRARGKGDFAASTLILKRERDDAFEEIRVAGGEKAIVLLDGTIMTLGLIHSDGEPQVLRIDR